MRTFLALVLLLLAIPFATAMAATSSDAQTASSPTPEQPVIPPPASAAPSTCDVPPSASWGAPSSTVIQLDPDTLWRPKGSEVRFTIAGNNGGQPSAITQVIVCFRWESTDPADNKALYMPSPLVRSVPNANGLVEYGAIIPPSIGELQFYGIGPNSLHVQHTALGTVPLADMAIIVQMAGSPSTIAVCRATITMRTRVNQDENPLWGEAGRA